mmetsp:Transcript_5182/g.12396  ORF Transcript_5182/g.12396 Transcript_5182/m.12396 type:complete len:205 (+) Transcript_5182:1639-2253(+)
MWTWLRSRITSRHQLPAKSRHQWPSTPIKKPQLLQERRLRKRWSGQSALGFLTLPAAHLPTSIQCAAPPPPLTTTTTTTMSSSPWTSSSSSSNMAEMLASVSGPVEPFAAGTRGCLRPLVVVVEALWEIAQRSSNVADSSSISTPRRAVSFQHRMLIPSRTSSPRRTCLRLAAATARTTPFAEICSGTFRRLPTMILPWRQQPR